MLTTICFLTFSTSSLAGTLTLVVVASGKITVSSIILAKNKKLKKIYHKIYTIYRGES